MIALVKEEQVKEALREGKLSQRKIAEQVGISRTTVNAIACGRRPRKRGQGWPASGGFVAPSGPACRCPTCGAMVKMPCLRCHLRA